MPTMNRYPHHLHAAPPRAMAGRQAPGTSGTRPCEA